MKKLKKLFTNLLIIAYAAIAITVTILLLSYNEYHCSVVGGNTFILVTDDELEPDFKEGELVIVKETKAKNINPGDEIFLYRRISNSQFEIKYAEVLIKDTSKGEYDVSYVLEGGTVIEHDDVIGSAENIKVIPYLGTILSVLESRYGYLFLIVVVSFIAFLYEIYELIIEIKYGDREEDEEYDGEEDEEYDDEEEYYDEDEYEEEPRRVEVKRRKPAVTANKKAVQTAKKTTTKTTTKTTPTRRTTTPKVEKTATRKTAEPKTTTGKTTRAKATTAKVTPTPKTTKTATKRATTKREISE